MANIVQPPSWADVPQLETTTAVLGGELGPMNYQAKALVARTEFLDDKIDTKSSDLAASGGSALVGYLPAGTGAVPTDVQTKLRSHDAQLANVEGNLNFTTLPTAITPVSSTDLLILRQGSENKKVQVGEIIDSAVSATETYATQAEAARDAALIGAGVYTTEALGRAAVADGVAFKVQGSGDVAAYEYRRTNSTTSVLIATYPSKGYIDSGRAPAGTANTARGAGYETINPNATGYTLTTMNPGVTIALGEVGYPITLMKAVSTGGSTWFGVHVRIPYTAISDLNKTFYFNAVNVSGVAITTVRILANPYDWNPANSPIFPDTSTAMDGGVGFNMYDAIMASPYAAVYQAQQYLYVLVAYFNPAGASATDPATAVWTIRPQFASSLDVIANKVTTALHTSLLSDAAVQTSTQLASGTAIAASAVTAEGAGYTILNPNASAYAVIPRHTGVSITLGSTGADATTITKAVASNSITWFGVYQKITYTSLADLDKTLFMNAVSVSGTAFNTARIVPAQTDWGPGTNAISPDVADILKGSAGINLYTQIVGAGLTTLYEAQNVVYIIVGYYNPSPSVINAATATWTIQPQITTGYDVIANKVTTALRDSLVADATGDFAEIASLVAVPKAAITNVVAIKYDAGSTATIDQLYTGIIDGASVTTGYATTIRNTLIYAYSAAQIFTDYATQAATKKYRVFVKADKAATVTVKFTNAASWGSSDGSISTVGVQILTLNAANNYQATADIDYTQSSVAAFYAQTITLNGGWYILACEGTAMAEAVTFSTYCYETTQSLVDHASDMTYTYVATAPTDVQTSISALETSVSNIQAEVDQVSASIIPAYITCWGDSLTAGGGWTTTLQSLSGLPVYNGGTGGENSLTIMARQGGDVMVTNNITIPATTTAVLIASRPTDGGIKTMLGATVTPLLQGGAHINPCKIGTITGTLAWTGSSYADMNGTWTFTRSTAGTEVVINRPTAIRTDFDLNRNSGIQVLFIGQNGGYTDINDLIRQHRLMIEHSTAKYTVVLGLSSGSAASRADYEAAMKLEFGRYFISLREYLSYPIYTNSVITSCYGLEDAGITPTAGDLSAIATGTVPPSLLADAVHFNDACKTVIGNMLYRRMRDLNIV